MMMKAMIKVSVHHEQHTPTLLSLPPALGPLLLVEQPLVEALGRNMVRDNQTNTGEKVHFKGNARKESQKEFLMICGTHLERRDGEQALLGLPSCSAEINNIHLSWKYDKSYGLIGFVT